MPDPKKLDSRPLRLSVMNHSDEFSVVPSLMREVLDSSHLRFWATTEASSQEEKFDTTHIDQLLEGLGLGRYREISSHHNKSTETWAGNADAQIRLWVGPISSLLRVFARTRELRDTIITAYKEAFDRPIEDTDDEMCWVRSYFHTDTGIRNLTRQLECPSLDDIENNYPSHISSAVRELAEIDHPWNFGKVAFWHGRPGTGKTYMIRALIREWRKRFDPLLILDPEAFLNSPQYLLQVLNEDDGLNAGGFLNDDDGVDDEEKAKLLIFEDLPNPMETAARKSGDAPTMSRLLNVTDGLIGQGVRSVFLFTTNDEVHDIDPAFLRDGRCLQRLFFREFTRSEACEWLDDPALSKDLDPACDAFPLSKLFAIQNGTALRDLDSGSAASGFAGFKVRSNA